MPLCTFAATTISTPFFRDHGQRDSRQTTGREGRRQEQASIYDAPPWTRRRKSKLAIVGEGYRWESRRRGVGVRVVFRWLLDLIVASSSCSRQPPRGLAGRLSCHQRFRFGSSQGTRSLLDPPSLKVACQPVPVLSFLPQEVLPADSFRFEPVSGGVIRSRSPDSVLRSTASCKALSRLLTQGQR
jgi:hypothetical protein